MFKIEVELLIVLPITLNASNLVEHLLNLLLGIRMRIFASRQCADYARAWYVLRFAVGEASCLVFVVSKPRWPRCAVVPDLHLHRPRSI